MRASHTALERKIIEAARRLFTERGFAATSMSDIAADVGINRPTLHYYFRTKECMFQAVFNTIVETLRPKYEHVLQLNLPVREAVGIILDEYENFFLQNPAIPRFIVGEINRDVAHLVATARELQLDKTFFGIGRYLAGEMAAGRIRQMPLHALFLAFYGLLTFPIFARPLLVELFLKDESEFPTLLKEWKQYVRLMLDNLLQPEGNTASA